LRYDHLAHKLLQTIDDDTTQKWGNETTEKVPCAILEWIVDDTPQNIRAEDAEVQRERQ
jgi:hypothetical protein